MEDSKPNKQVSGLSFAEAMQETKTSGVRVSREAWSILQGWVKFIQPCKQDAECKINHCLMIIGCGGDYYNPYNPTIEDIFACDWKIEVE